jgi:hypothetical protein
MTEHWGDVNLVDQMSEKRRLRQDFDIQERGGRLKDDRGELLATVKPTGRHDVANRNSEDKPADDGGKPSANLFPDSHRPAADRVVTGVDRLEQRFEMGRSPGDPGGGRQDQRMRGRLQLSRQNVRDWQARRSDDPNFVGPADLP